MNMAHPFNREIFETLEGSAYFTSIDMSAGFYQVPMEEVFQDYTASSKPFKWRRMPLRLTGSPPTFQCLVEKVLVGFTWKICVPYLDDIIIISSTLMNTLYDCDLFLNDSVHTI